MADPLDAIATAIEARLADGTEFNAAVQKVLEGIITDHGSVVFNGDGYSDDWQFEAEARGLKNLRTTVDALPELDSPEVRELFGRHGVLNERELASRYEVYLEHYHLSVAVEARSTLEVARTIVMPAALRYQGELAASGAALAAIGYEFDTTLLDEVLAGTSSLGTAIADLDAALAHDGDLGTLEEAAYARDALLPSMDAVRAAADRLESVVADDLWPLPTYQEMLFIL
jgi:glutamine synthetase